MLLGHASQVNGRPRWSFPRLLSEPLLLPPARLRGVIVEQQAFHGRRAAAASPPPSTKHWHVLDAPFLPCPTADSDVAARRLYTLPHTAGNESSHSPPSAPPYTHTPGLRAPRDGLRRAVSLRHNLEPRQPRPKRCLSLEGGRKHRGDWWGDSPGDWSRSGGLGGAVGASHRPGRCRFSGPRTNS